MEVLTQRVLNLEISRVEDFEAHPKQGLVKFLFYHDLFFWENGMLTFIGGAEDSVPEKLNYSGQLMSWRGC